MSAMRLAERIENTEVPQGSVAVFFLGQAGFVLKTSSGKTVVIDPYLTDCVERLVGFKRMMPTLVEPQELRVDMFLATHSHADHLDIDAVPVIAARDDCLFIGAPDCAAFFESCSIPSTRWMTLAEGESAVQHGIEVRAVYADHGELAPEAVGYVITVDGLTIYNVGDSALASGKILQSLGTQVDVMIAPINGAYGNLDSAEAVELAALVKPRLVIASHFWMFVEHGGDPGGFLELAGRLQPATRALVMAPGECVIVGGEAVI